jgi:signal transduction histidine kinase
VRISIRIQQTALFVAVIVAAMLVVTSWIAGELDRSIRDVVRGEQLRDASALAEVFGAYWPLTPASGFDLQGQVQRNSVIFADDVVVYDGAGAVLASARTLGLPDPLFAEARRQAWASARPYGLADLSSARAVVASQVIYDKTSHPVGVVVVANPATRARDLLSTARNQLAVAFWVALAISGLMGLAFSEVITRQVRVLSDAALAIADGDFGRRLPRRVLHDEVDDLAASYNRMAEQLGEAFDTLQGAELAQRQFVANASHEMRTPIAALKGSIELLEDGAVDKPEARDRFLATMHVEVDRLQRLVDELFTLAQLDSGRVVLDLAPTDVAGVVADVATIMRPLAVDAGVALETEAAPAGTLALMDRDRVAQVLLGFVDNSLKHTPRGGKVTVFAFVGDGVEGGDAHTHAGAGEGAAHAEPDAVTLGVRDDGPGIGPDALPHVFERLFRGETPAGASKGTGLGLSIAREIVEAHGSSVEVVSAPGAGATFSFRLPLAR